MAVDFSPFFARYEAILAEVDTLFATVRDTSQGSVTCSPGCSDCCHALFDLSLIEALYLNHHFNLAFPAGEARDRVVDEANRADRDAYKLKRKAFRASEKGVSTRDILADLARERIRCPLLGPDDTCLLYAHRPVTCRVYGAPLEISGAAHTCGKTGFTPGDRYPTIKVEKLQDKLMLLSQDLVASLPTKLPLMGDVLQPVSMAILTEFDDAYLGIITEDDLVKIPPPPPAPDPAPACGSCGEAPGSAACGSCSGGGGQTWVIPGPSDGKEGGRP